MYRRLSLLLWLVCCALSLSEAKSANLDLNGAIYYDFVFGPSGGGISILAHSDGGRYTYTTTESSWDGGNGALYPEIHFGFWHHADEKLSLKGTTLDLGTILASPPSGLQDVYLFSQAGPIQSGYVKLGKGFDIVEWDVRAYDNRLGEAADHWSEPVHIDALSYPWTLLDSPEVYAGRAVYGMYYYAPENFAFKTNPGYWSVSVQKHCYTQDGTSTPCLNLGPPLNGCGPSGGKPRKCDALLSASYQSSPASVPLPSPLVLLASGLAGIALLRHRRSRLAG